MEIYNDFKLIGISPIGGSDLTLEEDILCPICRKKLTYDGYTEYERPGNFFLQEDDLIGGYYQEHLKTKTVAFFHCAQCSSSFKINVDVLKFKKIKY